MRPNQSELFQNIAEPHHHEDFKKAKESGIRNDVLKNSTSSQTVAVNERYGTLLLEEIPPRLICFLCGLLMVEPIQTSEGRLGCRECFELARSEKSSKLEKSELVGKPFNDRATALEIEKLCCACENKDRGCEWEGTLKNLKNHVSSCMFSVPKCPFCNDMVTESQDEHLMNCAFIKEQKNCPYDGCNFKIQDANGLLEHLKNASFFHLSLQGQYLLRLKNEMSESGSELLAIQAEFSRKTEEYEENVKKLNSTIEMLTEQANQVKEQLAKVMSERSFQKEQSKRSRTKESCTKNVDLLNISKTVNLLGENAKELELHQQILENTSYNGRLLWKIDNYKIRSKNAREGNSTVLHSAPCFASRYGFKFCGRLYLNGDGAGKGTHMSLFFVLMKSEYDNLLKWPFQDRITLKLTSQDDSKKTITESFLPDKHSKSFQKPEKNMNVAAGFPKFISLENLDEYIKDDSFFLEISVQKR